MNHTLKTLKYAFLPLLFMAITPVSGQYVKTPQPRKSMLKLAGTSLSHSARQYHYLMTRLPEDRFPVTFYDENEKLIYRGVALLQKFKKTN